VVGFVCGAEQTRWRVTEDWGLECERVKGGDMIMNSDEFDEGAQQVVDGLRPCVLGSEGDIFCVHLSNICVMRTNATKHRSITRTWIPKMEYSSLEEEAVSTVSHTVLEHNHCSHSQR